MMQQAIMQMFQSNPLFQRARQMAEGKSQKEIEQIASNLCKQKGLDLNQTYNMFQNQVNSLFGGRK